MFILTCILIAFLLISSYPILHITLLAIIGCSIFALLFIYGLFCVAREWWLEIK